MLIYFNTMICEEKESFFKEIYLTYKSLMFYEANLILKDIELSENAVHDAFIKIIENIDKISEVNCPKTKSFVVIIVRRISINIYNKRKKENLIYFDNVEEYFNPPTLITFDESSNDLSQALSKLPKKDQQILILKYSHGFSINEISIMLDINEDALYKRIQRCKKKLRNILANKEALNL